MGALSRRKGAQGERDIVNILKAGGVPCKRISMMESGGIDKGDVLVADIYKGQVKRGRFIPKFFSDALIGFELLFTKRDRGEWLITMPLDFFLDKFI